MTLACAAPTVLVTLATFPGAREYRLSPGVRIGTGGAAPAAAVLRNMEALGIEVLAIPFEHEGPHQVAEPHQAAARTRQADVALTLIPGVVDGNESLFTRWSVP